VEEARRARPLRRVVPAEIRVAGLALALREVPGVDAIVEWPEPFAVAQDAVARRERVRVRGTRDLAPVVQKGAGLVPIQVHEEVRTMVR
jgi:hypothetical protein